MSSFKIAEITESTNGHQKPTWDIAPDWANSLGCVKVLGNIEWHWCSGTNPSGFSRVEKRPEEFKLKD